MKKYFKSVCGIKTEFIESEGNSLPIILFHGNSSSANAYESLLCSEIGKQYRLISVSFPGHGESSYYPNSPDSISIAMLGEFTHEVVKTITTDKYILIGQSLGGHALLEALQLHANAIGLCLISSPPISLETIENAFKPDPTGGLLFQNTLTEHEVERFASAFIKDNDEAKTKLLSQHIASTQGSFREALGQSLANGLVLNEINALYESNIPTIMLRGKHDQFLNESYYGFFKESKPAHLEIVEFTDAGHAILLDAPERFKDVLANFLSNRLESHKRTTPLN
ncbi:alpha/beta hydrolase [Catenovulum sp. SM1970]|uniref:alpha/beta fold hydrolase n=1 Tax=Marinifaba aquimaris TaxID=2741323 RepID=UPI001574A941|nr:alpha/beta hydrolase [Marinifaba aquimaris]NTS75309.1 alpha/beta hydrolase [Marinifaba aquimaris]